MAEESATSVEAYLQLVSDGRNTMEMLEDDDDDAEYDAGDSGLTEEMETYMNISHQLYVHGTSKGERSDKEKKKLMKYGKKVQKYRIANPDLAFYLDFVRQDKKFGGDSPSGRTYPGMVLKGVRIPRAMDSSPSVAKFMKFVDKKKKDQAKGIKEPKINYSATPEEFEAKKKKQKGKTGKKK